MPRPCVCQVPRASADPAAPPLFGTSAADTIAGVMEPAEKMCEIGRRAYARQLVAGTEGNLSCRLDAERVLCTPTGLSKGLLTPADLCLIDLEARQLEGRRRCSTEMRMHVGIYRAAPHVQAVVHTHPPFATTFSVLSEAGFAGVLPEGDIFLGTVPLVPYRTPGTAEMAEALLPYVQDHVAVLLQNHGTVTWGNDLETAYVLTEMLEAVCRVVYQARLLGTIQPIPLEKRGELARLREQRPTDV